MDEGMVTPAGEEVHISCPLMKARNMAPLCYALASDQYAVPMSRVVVLARCCGSI